MRRARRLGGSLYTQRVVRPINSSEIQVLMLYIHTAHPAAYIGRYRARAGVTRS